MSDKYRILTNGIKYKAQIKEQNIWTLFLPNHTTISKQVKIDGRSYPFMFEDIEFDTYEEAEQAAINKTRVVKKKQKENVWHIINR